MRVSRDRFAAVVNYLSTFADRFTPVLFTPVNDGHVVASVQDDEVYAEFTFAPESPLEARFAVRLEVLRQIAAVVPCGELQYREGSQAIIETVGDRDSIKGGQWWVPFADLDQFQPRPEFAHEGKIDWDGEFCRWLSLLRYSTKTSDSRGCLDCVYVDVRSVESQSGVVNPSRRLMVSTDDRSMQVYQDVDPVVDGKSGSVLIESRHIPKILATCESGAKVEIRIGLNHYSVRCGRRTAIFGRRRGVYPKAWEQVFKASTGGEASGRFSTDRHYLGAVVREAQSAGEALNISSRDGRLFVSSAVGGGRSEVELDVFQEGVCSLTINSGYLTQVAGHWPSDRVMIEARAGSPLVVRTPKDKKFTAIFQTMRRENGQPDERAEPTGRVDAGDVRPARSAEPVGLY